MSKATVKERRAQERKDTTIQIQGSPADGGAVARMVTRNLSLGGLQCTSTKDFPEMTRLAVRLLLPLQTGNAESEPVDVEAVVVRREETPMASGKTHYELALFFTGVADEARGQLRRFLDRQ